MAIQADNCVLEVKESIDQQLTRLSNCDSGGGGNVSVLSPTLYDAPVTTSAYYELPKGLPVNAPIDATKLEPGAPITTDPAPATTPVMTTTTTTEPVKKSLVDWIKENPLIAAGGGIALIYLLTRREGRKK